MGQKARQGDSWKVTVTAGAVMWDIEDREPGGWVSRGWDLRPRSWWMRQGGEL